MKFNIVISFVILILSLSCKSSQHLFQEHVNDWKAYGEAHWYFDKNELVGEISNGDGFVMTNKTFENFILELEFKPDSTINSGVFIRCKSKEINPFECYELNIWDLHPDQKNRTGAIVTQMVPLVHIETINKWNTYKIKAENQHIQVWINKQLTVDYYEGNIPEGFIGLQAKGTGKISFRKLKVENLSENKS